ncbi:MAG: flavin reductase family protein [Polaromonas sp.]|uniref:flavin reductase family protein n=1 Tax=Polaromonas sp. TaxID=1869339 RepID=UPI002488819D|nr:flavin reductase family protein [Polaromonas sp.]MDI1238261.1 flavin reductase family protein [Polaromonas sp.]MDI1341840.1 flavin reductase family protein [Polaromonas sp.]
MTIVLQATPGSDAPARVAAPDSRALRTALGQFATGITVVTTRAGNGAFVGLTVNSFSALSLEPPLILWSLRCSSPSLPVFEAAERFVVNVLAEAQVEVSRRFASPQADKFEGVPHAENAWGLPLLHGASAWFECRTVSCQIAGDHCLFIAEVERFTLSEAAPLLFHAGGYFALGSRL